jgi:flagellar hook-associated protein 2
VQGTLSVAPKSLQNQKQNSTDQQERIPARIDQGAPNLRTQYTALDATMAKMTALNNYVAQQITLWNKSSNNG